MIDFAKISVKAGDGGDGAGSFRHIKGKRRGKADGGSGGNGGNVYLQATYDLNTLEPYRFIKDYSAKNGQRGAPNLRKGAIGEDLVLKVPAGTMVRVTTGPVTGSSQPTSSASDNSVGDNQIRPFGLRALAGTPSARATRNRGLNTNHYSLITDLVNQGDKILVARGGAGGRGNAYLRDEYGRRPFRGERGGVGEVCQITLELKLIADVGLIGLPNSGKSTLLAALTAAKPQIAPYPFTTLEPNLGVLDLAGPVNSFPPASARSIRNSKRDQGDNVDLRAVGSPSRIATRSKRLILADIPGLIEGASKGKGLGDLFLRHIERTKLLLHLIDVSKGSEVPKVPKVSEVELDHSRSESKLLAEKHSGSVSKLWDDYQTIRNELKNYSKDLPAGRHGLTKKREIIVLTKSDLVSKEAAQSAVELFKAKKKRIVLISAVTKDGLATLAEILFRIKKS